jgi:hypothetical protein
MAAHLWGYFVDLSQTRQSGGMGPSRLTRLEIHAWEADECIQLERWERRAILMVDTAYLISQSSSPAQPDQPPDYPEEID